MKGKNNKIRQEEGKEKEKKYAISVRNFLYCSTTQIPFPTPLTERKRKINCC